MSAEGGIVLPTGCRLHVAPTASGNRWHAWCDCGWNRHVEKGQRGNYRTEATEKEAIKRNDQFIAGELFLLAVADSKAEIGNLARSNGLTRKSLEAAR